MEPKKKGLVIGLFAALVSVGLVMSGGLPDLGQWQVVLGAVSVLVILWSAWVVTHTWLAPSLFALAIIAFALKYFITAYFVVPSGREVLLVGIFSLLLEVLAFIVLVVGLVLQIRGLRKWLKDG